MKYYLQSRWKIVDRNLVYFGLRNKPNLFKNKIKLNEAQREIIKSLPSELSSKEIKKLKKLVGTVVVTEPEIKKVPKSLSEAKFCSSCVANDFMIPGLEFDEHGLCPMCQTRELHHRLKSILPVLNTEKLNRSGDYDIGLFYTGGKDSTYLLYYLSSVLRLRVLAMTWEIPFMSNLAKKSIANAKQKLPDVKFISKKLALDDEHKFYKILYELNGNTCACPSVAYVLFYPELVKHSVPYFIAGNEPVQMLGLYYNHMAPKIAYKLADSPLLTLAINIGRILSFKHPLKRGQFHALATMKQLAYGDSLLKKMSGYKNELVSNVVKALQEVPEYLRPLKAALKYSDRRGKIPAFVHIDMNEISGGVYDWNKIKDLIVEKCGWVTPESTNKGLHTSCNIEKCKEYTQFQRFYQMKSTMIPFSALEISLASQNANLSRDQALKELKESLGFSLDKINECILMEDYLSQC